MRLREVVVEFQRSQSGRARLRHELILRNQCPTAHQREGVSQTSVSRRIIRILVDSLLEVIRCLSKAFACPLVPKVSPSQVKVIRCVGGTRSELATRDNWFG